MQKRMMSKVIFFMFLAAIVLAPQAQAQLVDFNRSTVHTNSTAFGTRVAGSWLTEGTFSVDLGCDGTIDVGPIPFNDAQTFGVGGSHLATNPANPNTNHGTWTKTGPFQVSGRDISFGTTDGSLATIAIISFVFDFDRDFENATSNFGAKVYLPSQDPLDPSEEPIACSIGQHTSARKVSALE